jgi:molybdate transport system substrate-binding protein
MRRAVAILAFGLALAGFVAPADAAELKVWTAKSIANVLAAIGPQFEQSTGHRLAVSEGLRTDFAKRIAAGEPFDVYIFPPQAVDGLIRDGKIIRDTRTTLARSGIGVEVRAGAPKPDISTIGRFKRALVEAKSIGYLKVGSGEYIDNLIKRLGLAAELAGKTVRPDADIVSELVAKGEVELGVVVSTQIVTTPGVEFVGYLPDQIQSYLIFTAGVSVDSKAPDAARELIRFLRGPIAIPAIRAKGMEPG